MGYVGFNVISQKVIRLPKSYPVFNVGFEAGLKELLVALDSFENFKSIGRQGAFNYIGTLDAMDIGYGFVNWMTQNKTLSWVNERERTNHYPVLD
jgi:protoporphyrinogen oxidase